MKRFESLLLRESIWLFYTLLWLYFVTTFHFSAGLDRLRACFFSLYFIVGYNSGSAYPISIKLSLQILHEYTELLKESFWLFDSFDSLVSQFDSFGDISGSTYSIFVKPNLTFSV